MNLCVVLLVYYRDLTKSTSRFNSDDRFQKIFHFVVHFLIKNCFHNPTYSYIVMALIFFFTVHY